MNNQTITDITKIMDRGLMVIPNEIRKRAKITKGSYVKVIYREDEIILKPIREEEQDEKTYNLKGIKVRRAKFSKEEGLKILLSAKNIRWSKKDDEFLRKGRKQIEDRLKTIDKI